MSKECHGLGPSERFGPVTKLTSLDLPPLAMARDGQLDEGSISILNAVSIRLALHIEHLEGLMSGLDPECETLRLLRRRRRLTRAAYDAIHKLHWGELP